MIVGWRLAEEIAWARPERPGPEWWTLLDIAQDARDETRQGMPGMDYLTGRGKCSRRTLYRRLEALRKRELIIVIRKPAPGIRAIYEIGVIHRLPGTGDTIAGTRTGDTIAGTRTGDNECQTYSRQVTENPPTGDSPLRGTHSVIQQPSLQPRQDVSTVSAPPVEGARLSTGQKRSSIELAARQAAEARRQRETKETT